MSVVPLTAPYTMSTATLTIDLTNTGAGDDYTAAVSQAQFDPSFSSNTWTGIGGDALTFTSPASWALVLAIAQDLAPTGLLRFLLDHAGEQATVTLTPLAAEDPITAQVILAPGSIGGTADGSAAVATITMGVQGKPTFTVLPLADDDQDGDVLEYEDLTPATSATTSHDVA
jgi:hypothetical protein